MIQLSQPETRSPWKSRRAAARDGRYAAEVAVLERLGSAPLSTRFLIVLAAWILCIATSATPVRSFRLIMSPTAKTRDAGQEQSGAP
jgi:hypothetical protein